MPHNLYASLAEMVQQVRQNLQDVLYECGGTLRTTIPAGFRGRGNRAYFYNIFCNIFCKLLSNAIKYCDAHWRLLVELMATDEAGSGPLITFADNGVGIDLAHVGADVFQLYKRFHPQHPGRGVGLHLTKTYVGSMGGRIEVRSAVGKGT